RRGLRVIGPAGGRPGLLRGLVRIAVPLVMIEGVRVPLLLAFIPAGPIGGLSGFHIVLYQVLTVVTPALVATAHWTERPSNGFAAPWDLISGTRVVFEPVASSRRPVAALGRAESSRPEGPLAESLGPFRVDRVLEKGEWLAATDPVLRRSVWLLRRRGEGPSEARRELPRPGRPRWLQAVGRGEEVWDAFEASAGAPLHLLAAERGPVPWGELRQWLHDLASEIRSGAREGTLPERAGLDGVWLSAEGRAQLLDRPWPEGRSQAGAGESLGDLAGQQRFLSRVADLAESAGLPLHARPVLQSLADGRFEKLSFLVGTLQSLLERPARLTPGLRAAALFMLPCYAFIMTMLGSHQDAEGLELLVAPFFGSRLFCVLLIILAGCALGQLGALPFATTNGHALFRLAAVDAAGRQASRRRLLARWSASWVPLFGALLAVALWQGDLASTLARVPVVLWLLGAGLAALSPHRGWHDRIAGTYVVRQ
ncbi:MAG: hypothetical protein AAF725_03550, partial [Acidobacteriota bacterium]